MSPILTDWTDSCLRSNRLLSIETTFDQNNLRSNWLAFADLYLTNQILYRIIMFNAVECFWIQINHWTAKYITLKCCWKMWTRGLKGCLRWRNATSWLQNLDTLLKDGKTRTRGWNAARWWRHANSWLQDVQTLLKRTRNAARRRRNVNSYSQDLKALLEEARGCRMTSTRQHLAHLLKY